MLQKYRISSYAIIIGIALFILSPVVGCTQNEGNAGWVRRGRDVPFQVRLRVARVRLVHFVDRQRSDDEQVRPKKHASGTNRETVPTAGVTNR